MVDKAIPSKFTDIATGRKAGSLSDKRLSELSAKEARGLLYRGITLSDAEVIFRMDRRTILGKIAGNVEPCGRRGSIEIWQIRDIAPYLVKPAGSIEDYIKRMRPNDLPPLLSKEYWNGQRARQKFEEEEGDLWRTDKVIETLAEAFKTVRMNLLLIPDALERSTSLSDHQRDELQTLIDATLQGLRDALVEQFNREDGPGATPPGLAAGDVEHDEFFVPAGLLGDEDTRDEDDDL